MGIPIINKTLKEGMVLINRKSATQTLWKVIKIEPKQVHVSSKYNLRGQKLFERKMIISEKTLNNWSIID